MRTNHKMLAWSTCNAFFEEVAAAVEALGSCITIEMVVAGLPEELAKMRYGGDLTRPKEYPRKCTRMWLINFSVSEFTVVSSYSLLRSSTV